MVINPYQFYMSMSWSWSILSYKSYVIWETHLVENSQEFIWEILEREFEKDNQVIVTLQSEFVCDWDEFCLHFEFSLKVHDSSIEDQ